MTPSSLPLGPTSRMICICMAILMCLFIISFAMIAHGGGVHQKREAARESEIEIQFKR